MPTSYGGADTWVSTFNVPSDGDNADAASVNVGLEALGDRTKYLYNRRSLTYSTTGTGLTETSGTYVTEVNVNAFTSVVAGDKFIIGGYGHLYTSGAGDTAYVRLRITDPNTSTTDCCEFAVPDVNGTPFAAWSPNRLYTAVGAGTLGLIVQLRVASAGGSHQAHLDNLQLWAQRLPQ